MIRSQTCQAPHAASSGSPVTSTLVMKKDLILLALTLAAAPIFLYGLWFGIVGYDDWRYIHPFNQVQHGDSEDRVVNLLGRPHRVVVERTTNAPWESESKIDWKQAESVKEFRYIPFSITGEEYVVGFDNSGRAVSKFHISSP